MKNSIKYTLCFALICLITLTNAFSQASKKPNMARTLHQAKGMTERERFISFDADWSFKKDKNSAAKDPNFNDANWRKLDLPHDWSIEDLADSPTDSTIGSFYKNAVGKNATAFTVGGTAWYRKSFVLDKNSTNKKVYIHFDGVYMNSDVWINGQHLGNHPNGYTSFVYDLTPYLKPIGQKNVIAVEVKNEGYNSRWYSGSGIYRHVWLSVLNKTHIENWGVQIVSKDVSEQSANIHITTQIKKETANNLPFSITTEVYDANGKMVAMQNTEGVLSNKSEQIITLKNPNTWNIETPYLYKAKVILKQKGKKIDEYTQNFGVRSINFNAKTGFTLNGKNVKLKGGCIHHDNGCLGAAAYDRAEERKIELLKKNGYNAVRFSHNPYSPQLLDACDRLGILVMNEAFDAWNTPKTPDDYANYFKDWWQKDLTALIQRDFNHPAVIIWSIGNEIPEIVDTLGFETSAKLAAFVKNLDASRPVSNAIPFHIPLIKGKKWDITAAAFASIDVSGYNYASHNYESDHKKYPERIMVATEYFPPKALENWNAVEKNPYVIGMFSWTAMDYLGEAGLGLARQKNKGEKEKGFVDTYMAPDWPIFNAYTGEIDLIGNKKSASYYLDVVWRRSQLEMMVHRPTPKDKEDLKGFYDFPDEMKSWTWNGHENDTVQVRVFTRSEKVKLALNGKTIAEQQIGKGSITATFSIPYTSGKLVARCYKGDKEIASETIETVGKPSKIRLKADRTTIKADNNDLSYIQVEVIDEAGNVVPNCDDILVKYKITGNGSIVGVGNGNPRDMSSFQKPEKKVFQGKGLLIVKSTNEAGKIMIKANAAGLRESVLTIETK